MQKLAAHKTYFIQALDCVDELRVVDGKEGQLVRELKYVENLGRFGGKRRGAPGRGAPGRGAPGRGAPSVPQCVSASGDLDPRATIELQMLVS